MQDSEEGYAISSIFPLLSSRYNSPESQRIKKNKYSFRSMPSAYYKKYSMHVSRDDITATEVIYMFQSSGGAAAAAFTMSMCLWLS